MSEFKPNQPDKPGYKEDFNKNYRVWFWLAVAFGVISLVLAIFADDSGGWVGFGMAVLICLLLVFKGYHVYRRTFANDIKRGERDSGW